MAFISAGLLLVMACGGGEYYSGTTTEDRQYYNHEEPGLDDGSDAYTSEDMDNGEGMDDVMGEGMDEDEGGDEDGGGDEGRRRGGGRRRGRGLEPGRPYCHSIRCLLSKERRQLTEFPAVRGRPGPAAGFGSASFRLRLVLPHNSRKNADPCPNRRQRGPLAVEWRRVGRRRGMVRLCVWSQRPFICRIW